MGLAKTFLIGMAWLAGLAVVIAAIVAGFLFFVSAPKPLVSLESPAPPADVHGHTELVGGPL